VDIDAEMAKLQAEARRKLAERDREAAEHELPPEPMDPALRVPDVDLAAFGLAGEAEAEAEAAGLSLPVKLALLVAALIGFSVLWSSILAPIVRGLIAVLILALVVIGTVTAFKALRGKGEPEE